MGHHDDHADEQKQGQRPSGQSGQGQAGGSPSGGMDQGTAQVGTHGNADAAQGTGFDQTTGAGYDQGTDYGRPATGGAQQGDMTTEDPTRGGSTGWSHRAGQEDDVPSDR